jgi:peptidyl-tRNA hydrolase
LRIGIGFAAGLQAASPRGASKELPLEEYVLSPFDEEEACRMRLFLDEGIQACLAWLKAPIEKAMNSVNR